jgi:ketosteroid isomerase-like protein
MDHERADTWPARAGTWLEGYRRAWEEADTPAVLGLFTEDATYRSHPLRPAHAGHDGIAAYWTGVTEDQLEVRVRFGDPIVAGDQAGDRHQTGDGERVAVEWWTTMRAGADPVTLAGCLLLTFASDGRCQALRECWNVAEAILTPPPDWGRLGRPADAGDPVPPAGSGHPDPPGSARIAEFARRWADGYERAWRAGDAEAAAALYAPDAHYRSEAFRDPHLGREGVLAYTRGAYATEADQDPRFGTPFASRAGAAVEWWTTLLEEGRPATLIGTSFLTFTPDGLVATGRDYWFLEPGRSTPFDGWGR